MIYKKINIKNKKIYLGIEILRIFFSFCILLFHCINKKIYKQRFISQLSNIIEIALITFFIISFYFSFNCFTSKNLIRIKLKFKRLIIPYIIWPIIIYLQSNTTYYIIIKKKF